MNIEVENDNKGDDEDEDDGIEVDEDEGLEALDEALETQEAAVSDKALGTDEALEEALETQEAAVSDEALGTNEALDEALETDDAEEEAETQGRVDLVDNERPVEADEAEEDEAVDNKPSDESCLDTRSALRVQWRSQQDRSSEAGAANEGLDQHHRRASRALVLN